MTREEAIHFAECLKNNWTINFADMEEFCDMAIEALTHECDSCIYSVCNYNKVPWESNGDLISRQAVVDVLIEGQDGSGQTYELIGELIDKMNALPSAEPVDCTDFIRWIRDKVLDEEGWD